MKTHNASKRMKANAPLGRTPFRWTALLSLCVLFFALFASAQEIPCGSSSISDAANVRIHATSQHSEHCIRHQDPLPGFDSSAQTISAPGAAFSKIVVAILTDAPLTYRPEASLYDHGQTPHAGVSVYKIFARFLI